MQEYCTAVSSQEYVELLLAYLTVTKLVFKEEVIKCFILNFEVL